MKTSLISISLCLMPAVAPAQSVATADSIPPMELNEITVVGDNQLTTASKTVYIPDSAQKRTASDGIGLLARMNIPQLSVNPISGTVKTVSDQSVDLFINFHPASKEDVDGLVPADVKRVEYIDFPADPRFRRAEHVVNFITFRYEYGGYAKISAKERISVRSGEATVYGKFAYRSMEYDMMISGDYDYGSHAGRSAREFYKLDGGTISRQENTLSSRQRQRALYAGLRAAWNKNETFTFRNLVSYKTTRRPVSRASGTVSFSDRYPSEEFCSSGSSLNDAFELNSDIYANAGHGWSLDGYLRLEYRDNRAADSYRAGVTEVLNHADEDTWYASGNIDVNKSIDDRFSAFLSVRALSGNSRIDYTGSSQAANRFRQQFEGTFVGVSMNLDKLSGSVDGGYAFESNTINGRRTDDRYPFTHIDLRYAPDRKHSVGVWMQYVSFSPDAAMKNPNIIRQSEMMYVGGNADLGNSRNISANVSYTWLPDNMWQLTAYATLFRINRRQTAVYIPYDEKNAILKKYFNDGDYNHGNIGARLTGKFLDGRLSASVAPRLLLYKTTGAFSVSHRSFGVSADVNYYCGDFFLSAYYGSPTSYVDGETNFLRRLKSDYSISAGWTRRGWNVELSAVNLFRSSWRVSEDILKSKLYDSDLVQYGTDSHRKISISVTYTLNFGRKVGLSDELTGDKNVSSSILR